MEYTIPIQIIRESTISAMASDKIRRGLTPPSDRAWNLATALYYKAGGKPWRLATAREGVCHVGIAFRREDPTSAARTACCAAQMFIDSGDGVVFLGEYGPWYSHQDRQYHLTRDAAGKLLRGILENYNDLRGRPLREVFIHSRSWIDDEEFSGYQDAVPRGTNVVGIRVRTEYAGVKLFREGKWPVIRGSWWQVDSRSAYLWASGYKSRLACYDGTETPVPMRIDIQHGDGSIRQVVIDIFGLTKLQYLQDWRFRACNYRFFRCRWRDIDSESDHSKEEAKF